MAHLSFDSTRTFALGDDADERDASRSRREARAWAHVSGWAQLSGTPRHLSFVVVHRNARALGHLLPEISDTLTEIGFPWEISVVDNASTDGSEALLSQWAEVPGFNWIRLARDYGDMGAIATGLRDARGDAVLLTNASSPMSIELLPEVVETWEAGSMVVSVEWSPERLNHVVGWRDDLPDDLLVGQHDIVLLDRAVVDRLLR